MSNEEQSSEVVAEGTIESTVLKTDILPLQQPRFSSTEGLGQEFPHAQGLTGLKTPSNALKPYICERIEQLSKEKG
jgi:hypothetical protein